jgi:hypothetical protein
MLALLQGITGQVPGWLTVTWVVLSALQSLFIIGGIIAALYRFRKEKPHEDRMQPRTTGEAWVEGGTIYVRAVVAAENKGEVPFIIDHELSALEVFVRIEGSEVWESEDIFDVFLLRSEVQPGEETEDQAWIEIPYEEQLAVRLDLYLFKDEESMWPAREIISLSPGKDGQNADDE